MAMSAAQFAQMRHAAHWISTVYSNLFFFILGLPILLVRQPSFDVDRGPYRSPRQRIMDWWHLMNDRSRRREYILKSEQHSYNWFSIVMTVLFLVGWGFKATAASLTFADARKVEGTTLEQAVAYILAVLDWNNGKWWLGALAAHTLQYLMHVYHLMMCIADENEEYRKDAIIHIPMYAAAHVGFFNFAVNAPGLFIPNVLASNIIVIALNIVAISTFVFLVFAEQPMLKGWGCYPVWYSYEQYDFGLCPAYLSQHNPEVALAPVCTAVDGAVCDAEVTRWSDVMQHAWGISKILLFISFIVYAFSIPAKVEYYNIQYREAIAIAERTRPT